MIYSICFLIQMFYPFNSDKPALKFDVTFANLATARRQAKTLAISDLTVPPEMINLRNKQHLKNNCYNQIQQNSIYQCLYIILCFKISKIPIFERLNIFIQLRKKDIQMNPVSSIKSKLNYFDCSICLQEYNTETKIPMMVCPSQHSVCYQCLKIIFKKEEQKCPQCNKIIRVQDVQKYRYLFDLIKSLQQLKQFFKQQQNSSQDKIFNLQNKVKSLQSHCINLEQEIRAKDQIIELILNGKEVTFQEHKQQNQTLSIQNEVAQKKLQEEIISVTYKSTWSELENVCDLCLSGKTIEQIPIRLCSLKKLRTLDLSRNKIKVLPKQFSNLTHLRTLIIDHNLFSFLPEKIELMKDLQFFYFHANPLKQPINWVGVSKLKELKGLSMDQNYFTINYLKEPGLRDLGQISLYIWCRGNNSRIKVFLSLAAKEKNIVLYFYQL